MKLNLADYPLDEKCKEDFWPRLTTFMMYLVLGMKCPLIEVHLKLKDETPFLYDHILCMKNKRKSYKKKWIDSNI